MLHKNMLLLSFEVKKNIYLSKMEEHMLSLLFMASTEKFQF